ncbi:hypothetical protein [Herbaspirillum rubrisubalbicans]|uniref:Uncharacterized protein n=1 Tax=Herbaspirillum rubrisubalbicans TaxID=80842 RepID=A0AAD0UAU2_9BURK|nr:hypothetical protein [Herbaspirillum rubrisubalbicans]AYR25426.1 hypothetical protein RC54_17080 [Herbaspirillum rubrisubalbicans]
MEHKLDIAGDVAHLVNGNVHEAPQLSSVVNFNVLAEDKKVETLTQLQRRTIADLVDQLCAISGEEPLAVYRIILTDFGATKMRLMPREKYPQVKAQINQWIAEAKHGRETSETEPAPTGGEESNITPLEEVVPPIVVPQVCPACIEKDVGYARLQRSARGQWVLSAVLTLVCGFLLYRMPAPVEPQQVSDNTCYSEGKAYTTGFTIRSEGDLRQECIFDATSGKSLWSKPR